MKILLDENGIQRSITRISYEIIERNKTVDNIVLVGIKNRGDILAERIKEKIDGTWKYRYSIRNYWYHIL